MSAADYVDVAAEAARLGGRVLSDWRRRFSVSEKSPKNLVTEADFESQRAIHEYISGQYPTHGFLGEEGLSHDGSSDFRWVIDPLDGTSNYVHGFPYYAVSVAVECRGTLVAGAILDPTRDELFTAARGEGARLNGERIGCSGAEILREALVVASLPPGTGGDDPAVARFLRVLPHSRTVQRTGSAALNLAYVAMGRIDAYWSSSLKPWDMAAGVLLVEEAGGRVSRMDGDRFELDVPNLLASNGRAIHDELQALLS